LVCNSWSEGSILFYVLTYIWFHNQIILLWFVHNYSQIGKFCNYEFVKIPLNFLVNFWNFHFYNVMHKSMQINDSWVVSTFLWGFAISFFLLNCKNWFSLFHFFLVSWECLGYQKLYWKTFNQFSSYFSKM
jgi:RsiW-degrading membrane proteinase PrsW (M82 family)